MNTITALYVDDEPYLLEIAQLFLEKGGEIQVDTCTSPLMAKEKLNAKRYDIIISDYQMPEMDGIALLKIVRSEFGSIPFILFTGRGREEVVIEAINNGADFYLQKGGDPKAQFAELAHKIRQAVSQRRAEASIHDHERRESDIINFLPDATFAIDANGVVIAWNRAMERMTGITAAEILGKGDYEYALPFYHERRPILIDLVLREDPAIAAKYPFIKREGKTLFSEIGIAHFHDGRGAVLWFTASPLYDVGGTVVGAIESIRDTTERKRIEQVSRENEMKFREMADLLPQIVYEADEKGILTYANAIALETYGYTPEEFDRGIPLLQTIVPEEREKAGNLLKEYLSGKSPRDGNEEYHALRKDGSVFTVMIYTAPIRRGNRITGVRGVVVDISGQKQLDSQLKERERFLSTLLANLPGFVYRCRNDRDWTMTFISEGCREITGYSPGDFLNNRVLTYNDVISPDHRERIWKKWQELLASKEVFEDEYPVISKSGEVRRVWERGRGVFSEDGRLLFLEGFVTDVTRQRTMENNLAVKTAELERKGRYYEVLLRTSTDAIHVIDRDGRLREWNNAFLTHLGYTAEEAAGLNVWDWDSQWNRSEMRERINAFLQSGGRFETHHRRKDGTMRDVEITAAAVVIDGESLLYASARDITNRKRMEAGLRESEERYRNIVESFEDLYYETDAEGIIRFLSPSCERLTGWRTDELIGQPVNTVYVDENDRAILREAMRKTGYVRDYELVLKKRNGVHTPVSLSAHFMKNADGSLAGIAGSLRDISDRKKAEEEVRKSREQLDLAIRGSGAGLWDWHIPSGSLTINERWAEMLGYSPAELEPVSIQTWQRLCHPDDLKHSDALLQRHFRDESAVYELEARMQHKDGHWVWVLDRGRVLEWDDEHRPLRMIGTHMDITALKRLEGALRQANTNLNLMSCITRHDISNQLTSLKGFLALSRMNLTDPARMKEFLDKEERIAGTISRQIAFTRYYQDMGVKEPGWRDVDADIRTAVTSLSLGDIVLKSECDGFEIFADPLFETVFYNLVDNALRYGGEKLTTIRISPEATPEGLLLVCEDNGAGISAEEKKHLFERGVGKNTGLGLFLTREILGITGITIRENSEPGKGARFEILVPKGLYRIRGK